MLAPVAIGFRALQLLMAAAVVGLSVTLLKGQATGNTPTTTRYSVFTGAFGMIVAFLGLICLFISAIPAIVPMALDALAGLLLLAGGIAWAVGLKGIQCKEEHYQKMYANPLLNEGCIDGGSIPYCGVAGDDPKKATDAGTFRTLNVRCKYAMSDEIMQFILFLVSGILLFLGFLLMRKGKGGGRGARYG
ncbi:marvel domain-containing protein [Coniochaeta sp. 2T2.1]|nr:marvel domain-containing protein [Coniochaeta sp. 2T2.1]